jgi:hypothetical protein
MKPTTKAATIHEKIRFSSCRSKARPACAPMNTNPNWIWRAKRMSAPAEAQSAPASARSAQVARVRTATISVVPIASW